MGTAASNAQAWKNASAVIANIVATTLGGIEKEVASRAYRTSNHLRNAALYVLRGDRAGRVYKVPFTRRHYTASAEGEAPAVRTGIFRLSWGTHVHVERAGSKFVAVSSIESRVRVGGHLLGDLLEDGTSRMKARPYKEAVKARAWPKIETLYQNIKPGR